MEIAEALVSDGSGRIDQVLGVHIMEVRALPDAYMLAPNYPNPFNPETVVPFSMSEAGRVRVAVYNLLGQEVAVLADGHRDAGFHRVTWNGKDHAGREMSSGIYHVRITAGGFAGMHKMLLLK